MPDARLNTYAPIASAIELRASGFHAVECRGAQCGRWRQHREDAAAAIGVTSTRLAEWPIVLTGNTPPIVLCGGCYCEFFDRDQSLTTLAQLEDVLREHLANCDHLVGEALKR